MNGLASFPVSGTLWAFGHELSHESYEQLAQGMPWSEQIRAGVSKLEYSATHNLYLIRVLAQHAEDVKHFLIEAWQQLRPLMLNTPANHLRLWNT
ncbi:hypothetical protein [Paenalcaligenes niemegkensis]|uniref:hypothetical protein n=1 Tax=Paenalcaligenes niemegkensis TaxID=2895469 RepID=UPI001EE792EF|nr:hypothetical protein [Paenalcaligenes niemegkensis]